MKKVNGFEHKHMHGATDVAVDDLSDICRAYAIGSRAKRKAGRLALNAGAAWRGWSRSSSFDYSKAIQTFDRCVIEMIEASMSIRNCSKRS